MREPAFWRRRPGLAARALLVPLGALYGAIAARRLARRGRARRRAGDLRRKLSLSAAPARRRPCIALARMLARARRDGRSFLSRGYGGRLRGPVLVDPARHAAADVGDEPLLLARTSAVIVSRQRECRRRAGAARSAPA